MEDYKPFRSDLLVSNECVDHRLVIRVPYVKGTSGFVDLVQSELERLAC